jgi:hypothetical protein
LAVTEQVSFYSYAIKPGSCQPAGSRRIFHCCATSAQDGAPPLLLLYSFDISFDIMRFSDEAGAEVAKVVARTRRRNARAVELWYGIVLENSSSSATVSGTQQTHFPLWFITIFG